ncbi:MAG: laccase domain-containing protein [Actinomycetales bacterium]|nr:laccase domain-containing protein [Actinomycetales bacterium]
MATGRSGGASQGPFGRLNLAGHVGDDPADVRANRRLAAAMLGVDPEHLAVVNAVHGAEVAVVEQGGEVDGVDAVVTTSPGLGLLALAADCVPLALADPQAGVIGAVHCGWKGIGAGVVPAAVDAMRALGASDISAVIGPHVCAGCYPVSLDRIEVLRSGTDPLVADQACLRTGDGWAIDVGAGVRAQLTALGVPMQSIGACTAESPELFSFRRDGITGRHGMMIALTA